VIGEQKSRANLLPRALCATISVRWNRMASPWNTSLIFIFGENRTQILLAMKKRGVIDFYVQV
jgi:hypothetical protein